MLIAISGPSSSGKGTVLYDLESYGYCVIHQQYARTLLKEYRLSVDQLYQQSQSKIVEFHWNLLHLKERLEDELKNTPYPVFVERCFLDFYVYLTIQLGESNSEFFTQCIEKTMEYYTKIILLTECPCIESDGVRIANLDFINKQKNLFKSFWSIPKLQEKLVLVHQVNRRDRVNTIIQHL